MRNGDLPQPSITLTRRDRPPGKHSKYKPSEVSVTFDWAAEEQIFYIRSRRYVTRSGAPTCPDCATRQHNRASGLDSSAQHTLAVHRQRTTVNSLSCYTPTVALRKSQRALSGDDVTGSVLCDVTSCHPASRVPGRRPFGSGVWRLSAPATPSAFCSRCSLTGEARLSSRVGPCILSSCVCFLVLISETEKYVSTGEYEIYS